MPDLFISICSIKALNFHERNTVKEVKNWIIKEGRVLENPLDFINALCDRIHKSGIPLSRLRIGFPTIHPQIDIWAFTWTEEDHHATLWGGEHGIRNTDKYFGSPAEWVHTHKRAFRRRLTELEKEKDHPVLFEQRDLGFTDYLMVPVPFISGALPVISYVTAAPEGFTDQQVCDLEELALYISPIVEIHAMQKVSLTLLDTYIGHRSGSQVMSGHVQRGDGEVINAALWLSDIREFTALSEKLSHTEIFSLLNSYFQCLADAVKEYNGEILKFIGDAALVIFPVDEKTSAKQACENALNAAKQSFKNVHNANVERRKQDKPDIHFGIGLHFGPVVYGNVGALDRLDFTVTGPAVNLTARLESLTKETGKPLLLSQDFATQLNCEFPYVGEYEMKGIKEKQPVFTVNDQ